MIIDDFYLLIQYYLLNFNSLVGADCKPSSLMAIYPHLLFQLAHVYGLQADTTQSINSNIDVFQLAHVHGLQEAWNKFQFLFCFAYLLSQTSSKGRSQ